MKRLIDMTEPELRQLLDLMATALMEAANVSEVEKPHFTLLLWNDPAVAQYVCNCDRSDVIKALRESADRLERNMDVPRGLGASGHYPDGKLNGRDEGELTFAVGSDRRLGKVLLTFGKPVAWMGMGTKQALQMSDALRWHATKIGG